MIWQQVLNEVSFTAIRSRGPGGQNVNKVSSSARLYWNLPKSSAFNEQELLLLLQKLGPELNKEGDLLLRSDEFRDLERNKERCLEKLRDLLAKALFKPKPRKKTKPTYSAKKKRREGKERDSKIKQSRKRVDY